MQDEKEKGFILAPRARHDAIRDVYIAARRKTPPVFAVRGEGSHLRREIITTSRRQLSLEGVEPANGDHGALRNVGASRVSLTTS